MKIDNLFFALLLTTIVLYEANAWRRRRRRSCNNTPCTWIWGTCSKTCGGGYQSPVVTKSAGSCGSCTLPSRRSCNTQCCRINCRWGSWGSYGSCSASCQGGIQVSKRSYAVSARCRGSPCIGDSTRSRICNNVCCPVDCKWAQWTAWGACSRAHGKGLQKRHRHVDIHSSCGGAACQGNEEDHRFCSSSSYY